MISVKGLTSKTFYPKCHILKIHVFKILFFTKFTFSKPQFSQNSHFQSLIFYKLHIFKRQILVDFWIKSWFSPQCDSYAVNGEHYPFGDTSSMVEKEVLSKPLPPATTNLLFMVTDPEAA